MRARPEAHAGVGGAVAALAAAGEAVEDDVALVLGHPVAAVLDRDLHLVVGQLEGDGGGAAGVALGVVEEVGDDPAEAPLVDPHDDVADVGVVAHRHAAAAEHAHGLDDHLGDQDLLEVELDGAHVEAGDLEQVLDQLLEAVDVGRQQHERGAGPLGHLLARVLEHLDRGGERHERGAQLVADLGGEAGIAFDAVLEGLGHLVERLGDEVEVGVAADGEVGCRGARRRWPRRPGPRRGVGRTPAGSPRTRRGHRRGW